MGTSKNWGQDKFSSRKNGGKKVYDVTPGLYDSVTFFFHYFCVTKIYPDPRPWTYPCQLISGSHLQSKIVCMSALTVSFVGTAPIQLMVFSNFQICPHMISNYLYVTKDNAENAT